MCMCTSKSKNRFMYWIGAFMYTIRRGACVHGATSVWLGKPNKLDKSCRLDVIYSKIQYDTYINIAVGNTVYCAYSRWMNAPNNNGRDKTSEKPMTIKSIFNQWNSLFHFDQLDDWTIQYGKEQLFSKKKLKTKFEAIKFGNLYLTHLRYSLR